MLTRYIAAAMGQARYRVLEDGTFYGEIPSLAGVWSAEQTLERCGQVLQEVLEEWVILKLSEGDSVPVVGGIDLNRAARARKHTRG